MIAVEKASLAFEMMVQVRNKIVQAYQSFANEFLRFATIVRRNARSAGNAALASIRRNCHRRPWTNFWNRFALPARADHQPETSCWPAAPLLVGLIIWLFVRLFGRGDLQESLHRTRSGRRAKDHRSA